MAKAKKDKNDLEVMKPSFLIYLDYNGIARVNVQFEGKDVIKIK